MTLTAPGLFGGEPSGGRVPPGFHEGLTADFSARADGRLIDCNATFARLFGFQSNDDAKAGNLAAVFPHADARRAFFRRLAYDGRILHDELELATLDGRTVYVVASAIGESNELGQLGEVRGSFFDVTPQKKLEQQLRQSLKMEAIGRLAGGVAHDFNNLLMVVLGQSEGLLAQLAAEDPLRRGLESIRTSADRATRLTQQLLAFSRRQPMSPCLLDLNGIVTGMESLIRPLIGEHIRLVTKADPALWLVEADSSHVEQILMNLAVNARDAMPGGGTLAIGTRNVALDQAAVAVLPPMNAGRYVLLTVADTGLGMTAEIRSHLFEPFFTTKERGKGTGLGLSTVYGTVKQSQGFIFVDSEVGAGSTFRIYLPRREGSVDAVAASIDRPERGAETVLLAEDEHDVRALLREMLERQGYTVIETANGRHALETARCYTGRIDLLVTDVVMPEMGGHELAERLAEARPGTPVLFLSGYDDDAIRNHNGPDAGSALLQKPFTAAMLSARVRRLLDDWPPRTPDTPR